MTLPTFIKFALSFIFAKFHCTKMQKKLGKKRKIRLLFGLLEGANLHPCIRTNIVVIYTFTATAQVCVFMVMLVNGRRRRMATTIRFAESFHGKC